jgi:hypothetical protein
MVECGTQVGAGASSLFTRPPLSSSAAGRRPTDDHSSFGSPDGEHDLALNVPPRRPLVRHEGVSERELAVDRYADGAVI